MEWLRLISDKHPTSAHTRRWQAREDLVHAKKIRHYGDLGYLALVLPIALAFWLGRTADPLVQDLLQGKPHWLQFLAEFVFEAITLPSNFALESSLLELLAVVYLIVGLSSRARRRIGEAFADWAAWVLHRLIEIAEWCLGNRWWSIFLLIILCGLLTLNVRNYIEDVSLENAITSDFRVWQSSVEEFLNQTSLYRSDDGGFASESRAWNPQFAKILTRNEFKLAARLHRMIEVISDPKGKQWLDHLVTIEPTLHEEYEQARRLPQTGSDSARFMGMIRLLLGMVHVRLGEDDCSSIQNVAKAHAFLSSDPIPCCQTAVHNWQGNVYNCAHKFLVKDLVTPQNSLERQQVVRICLSEPDCLNLALEAYATAAEGAEECSTRYRRRINNTLDLKMKLALDYQTVILHAAGESLPSWMESQTVLASEIETAARELQRCNKVGPAEPLAFVTTAQAFAAAAGLRDEGSAERATDLRNAGAFIRLANSYQLVHLPKWDLEFFCAALVQGGLHPDLTLGLDAVAGLPEVDRELLRGNIQRRCR